MRIGTQSSIDKKRLSRASLQKTNARGLDFYCRSIKVWEFYLRVWNSNGLAGESLLLAGKVPLMSESIA